MNKTLLITAGLLLSTQGLAADTWPQPESAYHATQPRAQWLEVRPPAKLPSVPATPQMPNPYAGGMPYYRGPYGYPAYGYPMQPPYPYAYRRPHRSGRHWPWDGGSWPSWNNLPSPSFSAPSFSFPTPGW